MGEFRNIGDPINYHDQDEPSTGNNTEHIDKKPEDPEEIINNALKNDYAYPVLASYWGNFDGYLPGGYKSNKPREKQWFEARPKTYGDLYDDINRTIEELGLDSEKIRQLHEEMKELNQTRDIEACKRKRDECFRYIAPVYLAMLTKGYTKKQLYL